MPSAAAACRRSPSYRPSSRAPSADTRRSPHLPTWLRTRPHSSSTRLPQREARAALAFTHPLAIACRGMQSRARKRRSARQSKPSVPSSPLTPLIARCITASLLPSTQSKSCGPKFKQRDGPQSHNTIGGVLGQQPTQHTATVTCTRPPTVRPQHTSSTDSVDSAVSSRIRSCTTPSSSAPCTGTRPTCTARRSPRHE